MEGLVGGGNLNGGFITSLKEDTADVDMAMFRLGASCSLVPTSDSGTNVEMCDKYGGESST